MKKAYTKPACEVVEIQNCEIICQSPKVDGNADVKWGGPDTPDEPVRARQVVGVDWDDWEE
jgi:hypothetical protein